MPSKTWTSQADFVAWDWTDEDTDDTPGSVKVAVGASYAEGVSPIYECASYAQHSRCLAEGSLPTGSNIIVCYRIGATEVACGSASYGDWFDGFDAAGSMRYDLLVDMLNAEIDPSGKSFVQYKVRLYRG